MRLRNLFRRRTTEREMREEMDSHLERATERLIARSLSPDAARRAALRKSGNVGMLQEEGRDARGARWIESVAGDIRFALRYFTRKPLTTATIVLVLSIGIGVHAAVFSLIQGLTMRPAPGVPRDDALVAIRGKERLSQQPRWRKRDFSYLEFRDFVVRRDVFESVAGWIQHPVALDTGDDDGREAQVQFVTGGFFSTIGIRPVLGAGLPFDDHPETSEFQLVAVVGHTLWRDTFASSPDVLGTTIRVNDVPVRVVGVAPPRFNGAVPNGGTRTLWMPLSARVAIHATTAHAFASRDSALLGTVGRLREGATIAQADAAVRVIDARSAAQATLAPDVIHAADVVPLRGNLSVAPTDEIAITSAVFETMALLILLITCTNVSALVVGAAVARRHEIAIRLSLGASRGRLVRQLLTESSLLAMAGGVLGLLVYWWLARLVVVHFPKQDIIPDLTTVAVTIGFALGTGILVGLSPALHATRRGAAEALKDSTAGSTARARLQHVLVVAQIALTQPLLVGLEVTMAILLQDGRRRPNAEVADQTIRAALNPASQNRFRGDEAVDVMNSSAYKAQAATVDDALRQVAELPGVVGIVQSSIGYSSMELTVVSEDRSTRPQSSTSIEVQVETPGPEYFGLLDIPILRGRVLVASDTAASEVPVVIGSDLAHDLWGTADPIDRRFDETVGATGARRYVVVGVYDSRHGMASGARPVIYAPMLAFPTKGYLIRTIGPAAPLKHSVQSIIHTRVPHIPIGVLETLAERDRANRDEALTASGAAGGGGLLALLLASIGLYGVVALALGQRRREIGVRIALGARPQQVVRMLFGSGLRLSLTGLALGLPLSIIAMRVAAAEMSLPDINITVVGAGGIGGL